MNLYIYNEEEERILNKIDLGDDPPLDLIDRIISFLEENEFCSNDKSLIVAKNYSRVFDKESNSTVVRFQF